MKHIGIIAEYNPFHNGHAYQLHKAKELFPGKQIIVLMSGNYVQRGEPAIYNKYLRTRCALAQQADVIFELPLIFACASAEHFAHAAVQAFSKMGVIDTLCFGAETDNLALLKEIAHLFVTEPDYYKTILQEELKKGNSFPKARMIAASACISHPDVEHILHQPNNILAIEYLKAIETCCWNITPVIIKRIGNHYHDTTITSSYSSATAIRNQLRNENKVNEQALPAKAFHILQESEYAKPIFSSDFYEFLQCALWREHSHLTDYLDVSQDLANQICATPCYPTTSNALVDTLTNKQYTSTRIQRALMNILLGITKTEMMNCKENGYISYLRLLGFQRNSSFLLKDIKEKGALPIINKVANAKNDLPPEALLHFEKELQRTHLYNQIFYNKYGIAIPSEYEHSVIIPE